MDRNLRSLVCTVVWMRLVDLVKKKYAKQWSDSWDKHFIFKKDNRKVPLNSL